MTPTASAATWRTGEPDQGAAAGAVRRSHQLPSLWPNPFRLLLDGLAYTLIEGIRPIALVGTELARAQASTIRLKLFKIGTMIERNTRRIYWRLSGGYPYAELFRLAARRLRPG